VAAAVVRAAHRAGAELDDGLLIWELAGGRPAGPAVAPEGDDGGEADIATWLGAALEDATDDQRRRAQGLHVTPRWLADHLVGLALAPLSPAPSPGDDRNDGTDGTDGGEPVASDGSGARLDGAGRPIEAVAASGAEPRVDGAGPPTVCDPACGGGAFLVAAARHLHRSGLDRRHVVRHLVWGADVDPVGLAAAEAALALWAGEAPPPGRLVVADPLARADVWPDPPPGGFDAVVGNPPFQSQLGRATARSAADRRHLRQRFGPAVRAYTDTAWLFLLVGCELARPGGRVVLVEPQSVVAARDAVTVRDAVDRQAHLRELWVDDGRVFAAAVRVCAPVLERRHPSSAPESQAAAPSVAPADADAVVVVSTSGVFAAPASATLAEAAAAPGDRWGRLWARASGVPPVELAAGSTLGERATVIAGFRDQYYGLVDAVREHVPGDPVETVAPLVTSGTLDWAASGWGERPARYAKRRWLAPVVDLDRLAIGGTPVARRWVARTRAPKLVVATQTRVVEAAVDVDGAWVPSVPALAVVPTEADDLWRLAAAVLSPAATAWLVRRAPGTALDRGAIKVAGPDLTALPLPTGLGAWQAAAVALRAFTVRPQARLLDDYLAAIGRAYGTPATLSDWWRLRAGTAVRCDPANG
jgi:hypothetical protein